MDRLMINDDILSPDSTEEYTKPVVARLIDKSTGNIIVKCCWVTQTSEDRQLGFQYQPSMTKGQAIWFSFEEMDIHPIHMRNVYFPLLVMWLDSNMFVCEKTIAYPNGKIYMPEKPSRYIVECHPSFDNIITIGHQLILEA